MKTVVSCINWGKLQSSECLQLETETTVHCTSQDGTRWRRGQMEINPFTAMLAAPSLGKWPITVPNLKSLSLWGCFLAPFHEHAAGFVCSVEIGFVTGPSNTLFVCTFQPGNLTCWGSEGVNRVNCNNGWREIQTHKRFKGTLFIRTKHNLQILGVIPFDKLQNNTWTTVKWEKRWKMRWRAEPLIGFRLSCVVFLSRINTF